MLTRRTMLVTTAAGVAASSMGRAEAATPANILVMAKAIDSIVGAFDPAESYETANNEACGNIYRKLIIPDPADANKLIGDLAESWQVSPDGLTFTFQIRRGVTFDSGNVLTAEDAAFSLQRAVKLNKTPGFILTQFGWNADNVEKMVRATGEFTLEIVLPTLQATTFVLYCLSATIGGVVEKQRALANQTNNDFGNAWLRTHSAGAGSYRLVEWQASDHIIMEANPHAAVKPKIPRIVIRHVAEPATQLLLLQKSDTDMAWNLSADQIKGIARDPAYAISKIDQLNSLYLGLNAALPQFQKIEVRQAIKYAIDYDAIANNIPPMCGTSGRPFCRRIRRARSTSGRSGRMSARRRRCSPPAAILMGSMSCSTIIRARPTPRSPRRSRPTSPRSGSGHSCWQAKPSRSPPRCARASTR